ncbi:MAG: hypothetical protein ACREA0_17780, partial [bacterium]
NREDASPNTEAYDATSEVSGRLRSLQLRAEANTLRGSTKGSRWATAPGHSTLVQVFLWEEDVDAAWQEAKGGGWSPALWLELARRREQDTRTR